MATKVKLSVTLNPVGEPWVRLSAHTYQTYLQLQQTTTFDIEFDTDASQHELVIQHTDKHPNDPTTAVVIQSIDFFGISSPRFVWSGVYYPEYPDHYPDKISPLPGHNYLGWNGLYRLQFDVPVFTWIHKQLDFGWLYQ